MKFVDKQLAIKLKEKGFNKSCFGYYGNDELIMNYTSIHLPFGGNVYDTLFSFNGLCADDAVDAPTIDQVLRWLREEKNIYISIDVCKGFDDFIFAHEITSVEGKWREDNHYYDSYNDACIAGINFIVEHLI